ncbi:hypothetical protein MMC17_003185 [Xylographa soralifera]|nr:hypothetical protein [Xylographa soralifera]
MSPQPSPSIVLDNLTPARTFGYEEAGEHGLERRQYQNGDEARGQEFSLPQADGGRDAWLFLAGCFAIEALVWGFPFSFGIFQEYYSTHAPFSASPSGIPVVGTTAAGIMYLSGPVMFAGLQHWPTFRRRCPAFGLAIIAISLVAASFATQVSHLIVTQGVLYAIGGTLLYCPAVSFLDEWFVRRKGMAWGIMLAGTGMGGVIVPFVMNWGLYKYGSPTMLRAWAITLVLLSGPLLFFVKPRIPITHTTQPRPFSFRFLNTSTFWINQIANIFQGLGFFIPSIYLPSYARSLGLSNVSATLTVSLVNTTSVFGAVLLGGLIDKLHVTTVALISSLGATTSIFLLWGLSASFPVLCVFSLLYGLFAGGFSCTWTGIIREVQKREPGSDSGLVFGFLGAGRGIGSVAAGPLSDALLSSRLWYGQSSLGYGSGYGLLIVFTGVTTALGGLGFVAKRVGWV